MQVYGRGDEQGAKLRKREDKMRIVIDGVARCCRLLKIGESRVGAYHKEGDACCSEGRFAVQQARFCAAYRPRPLLYRKPIPLGLVLLNAGRHQSKKLPCLSLLDWKRMHNEEPEKYAYYIMKARAVVRAYKQRNAL